MGKGQGVLSSSSARTCSKYQEMISLLVLTFTQIQPPFFFFKGRGSSCSFSLCLHVCVSQYIFLCILVFCPSYVWLFWHISLSVCVCGCVWVKERERTHGDGERWGEIRGEQEETASPADFQLLCFSPSLPGSSFLSCSFSPLTWSPCLPCGRIDPHCVFRIFLIPPPRSRALGRHDVPHLVVWPNGGE